MYIERNPPDAPPCSVCRILPEPENTEALKIFFLTQNQFIMGVNGPVDINHLAVHAAMELYGVKNRRECFGKVMRLNYWWIDRISARGSGNA